MHVPENGGHSTLYHGFTIVAAVILPDEYHRPPFQKVPFFFVHINKTDGTSIINRLRARCTDEEYVYENWGMEHRAFHSTAQSFINYYGRNVWDKAYSFTVVRHPLARQVSNFFFLGGRCSRNSGVCKERLIPEEIWGEAVSKLSDDEKIQSFHRWLVKLYEKYPPGSEESYFFGSKTVGNHENKSFNATQTSWLVDDNDAIVVKDIIHLEQLDESMKQLTDAIPCLKSPDETIVSATSRQLRVNGRKHNKKDDNKKVEFDHANVTPKYPDWKLFAKDEMTRKIIQEVYEVDFKNFGYEMPEY